LKRQGAPLLCARAQLETAPELQTAWGAASRRFSVASPKINHSCLEKPESGGKAEISREIKDLREWGFVSTGLERLKTHH
jgi:hypothetical protein